MSRHAKKLTAKTVEAIKEGGRHADGDNLYLVVTKSGTKNWVLLYDFAGKRREMGLGTLKDVTLADARKCLANGVNPLDAKTKKRVNIVPTFGVFADEHIETMRPSWRNEKHAAQWEMTLSKYASSIRSKPVNEITTDDILNVLKPLWGEKAETASRLRGRLERVLDAAKAKGYREGKNPARWRGHLDQLLPKRKQLSRGHHEAMPFENIPSFMLQLRAKEALSALALEFTILTAARTSEVLLATWQEFDFEKAIWTVPAHRMKAGKEHRVPLAPRALHIIKDMKLIAAKNKSPHVSGHGKEHKPLSNMAMAIILKRMGHEVTVHGFRSCFRDWASETTLFPHEVYEMALAHVIANKSEAAYRRGDLFEKRRQLMEN